VQQTQTGSTDRNSEASDLRGIRLELERRLRDIFRYASMLGVKGVEMEKWTDIAEHFEPSQDIENTSVLAPKKRPPNPSRFRFEQVNEVTWKLTNGEMTNVPASHGQWAGYRTTRAIAWVIQVEGRWLARCEDQTSNPKPPTRPRPQPWQWPRVLAATTW
jgi:hypothetical protein